MPFLCRALRIMTSCKGEESVATAIATCNLADVRRAQGETPLQRPPLCSVPH